MGRAAECGSGSVSAVAEVPGPGQPQLILDSLEESIVDVGTLVRRDALLDPRSTRRTAAEPPD